MPESPKASLQIEVYENAETRLVCLQGHLTSQTQGPLLLQLRRLAAGPPRRVVLDLAGLEALDSQGMGLLIQLRGLLKKAGRELLIYDPSPNALQALNASRLHLIIGVVTAPEAAGPLKALRRAEFKVDPSPSPGGS